MTVQFVRCSSPHSVSRPLALCLLLVYRASSRETLNRTALGSSDILSTSCPMYNRVRSSVVCHCTRTCTVVFCVPANSRRYFQTRLLLFWDPKFLSFFRKRSSQKPNSSLINPLPPFRHPFLKTRILIIARSSLKILKLVFSFEILVQNYIFCYIPKHVISILAIVTLFDGVSIQRCLFKASEGMI